jgi:hypothetical protein
LGCKTNQICGLIAAPEGIAEVQKEHPEVPIHIACIDERLTGEGDPFPAGYIFPGLGDAGDRQFGDVRRLIFNVELASFYLLRKVKEFFNPLAKGELVL